MSNARTKNNGLFQDTSSHVDAMKGMNEGDKEIRQMT